MSLQHFGKGALRVAKNYTKGYSDTQAKVRDATSNDPWGPSGTQMNEIAQLSYNQNDFVEIMEMLDKRLNDKGKNWRHVFKSLTVLDYLLHAGSENVVLYFRDNLYIIKTLKEFQYVDEDAKDCGANVRQKAKDISNLLSDPARLQEERRTRASMRDRMIKGHSNGYGEEDEEGGRRSFAPPPGTPPPRKANRGADRDEDELRKAIEASKKTLAEEQGRKAEEQDLATAIRLSEEEEAKRHKAVEDSNADALFDDQAQISSPNGSNSNNPFPFIDPTPYATGLQPQPQMQPQYTVQPQYTMQPQFTSFNPYQQQAQQEAMQAEYLRQQQEWLHQQQEAQAQAQQLAQQAAQEEWFRQQQQQQLQAQQQQQQQQALFSQPTGFGSNNPFAPASSPIPVSSGTPVNGTSGPSFNLQGTYSNSNAPSYNSSPVPSQLSSPSPGVSTSTGAGMGRGGPSWADQEHSHLASLFANRDDGQDTFGNVGALRYGQTHAGLLAAQKTGFGTKNNPFQLQQQHQGQNTEQPFFSI